MKPVKLLLPLSLLTAFLALPSLASADALGLPQQTCWQQLSQQYVPGGNDKNTSYAQIMASINTNEKGKAYLESGANVYLDSIEALRAVPSSTPVFVSSLPTVMPTDTKAKAAYKRQKAKEVKVRAAMSSRSEENLQLLVNRAQQDLSDTADERALAISQNAARMREDLDVLQQCDEFNAQNNYLNVVDAADKEYQRQQELADEAYTTQSRAAEDKYDTKVKTNAGDSRDNQELCRKNPGGTWIDPDGPDQGDPPKWEDKTITVPRVKGKSFDEAKTILTGKGFTLIQKKTDASSKGSKVTGSNPTPGTRLAPTDMVNFKYDKPITVYVGKGAKGKSARSVEVSVAKKKDKKKPKPPSSKPKPPSSSDIEACQDREATDPESGSEVQLSDAEKLMGRELEDAGIARNKSLNTASQLYNDKITRAERDLANPFNFVVPYERAVSALDKMVELQELRSGRQRTVDERAVEDAGLAARDYLRTALNNPDISL